MITDKELQDTIQSLYNDCENYIDDLRMGFAKRHKPSILINKAGIVRDTLVQITVLEIIEVYSENNE